MLNALKAEKASWNSTGIFKVSNITGKRRELLPKHEGDRDGKDSDSEDDSDDEDEHGARGPTLQLRKVTHEGCVNGIRSMSQNPHICAAWADTGYVQVWDLSSHLNALAESETEGVQGAAAVFNQAPLYKHKHKYEGYAIDWSLLVPGAGRLVSDYLGIAIIEFISGNLRLLAAATWNIDNTPFVGHTASVEDLQWSPTEPHVFASCSVDGSIAIWDTRWGKLPAASFKAHNADVNVMPWNRLASCMFASGSDDGTISIRDLRLLEV
ncbi:hypothetical protein HN873_058765 [Arachis hypogaea]